MSPWQCFSLNIYSSPLTEKNRLMNSPVTDDKINDLYNVHNSTVETHYII